MVVFTQEINGVIGCSEWNVHEDDYDYHQEIARSGFADMLHDTERNQKYFIALKAAIDKMHEAGKPANVLDIGTGTGLLSIMAAQCGADSIIACEGFPAMASCAIKIIEDNGFADKITVIAKRSTDIKVSDDSEMKQRANILVTEVFDTELIGEGALFTFTHAHDELLEKDCIVVPDSATIFAQVVECPMMQKWNKLVDVADEDGDILIHTPREMKECNGSAAVHDIQLSQHPLTSFKQVLPPFAVLQYDFSGRTRLTKQKTFMKSGQSLITGNAQMVFMWWDLKMDTEGKVLLSCAPWWSHPDVDLENKRPQDTIPWRDHWMQAVYYFPKEIPVTEDEKVLLVASHDEYSLWFSLKKNKSEVTMEDTKRPVCDCGAHMKFSRTHIACMNDGTRNKKLLRALKKNVDKNTVCLCLNGASLMGMAVAKMGAQKVIYIESGIITKRILQSYISFNNLWDNVVVLPDVEAAFHLYPGDTISLILGDPNYNTAIYPWDNLHLGHIIETNKSRLRKEVKILPGVCSVWGMAVEFLDLHKIKAPLGICENINLAIFDKLVKNSRDITDMEIEPQPLWEYPAICRSKPVKFVEVDMTKTQETTQVVSGSVPCEFEGTYNGFAMWLEWEVDEDKKNNISTGPVVPPEFNEIVTWDPYSHQAVQILEEPKMQRTENSFHHQVKYNLLSGHFVINVSIK